MEQIPNIQVIGPNIQVREVPYIRVWMRGNDVIPYTNPPLTLQLGFPIVDIPGCVTMHQDNKYHRSGLPIDKNLIENDPDQAMTLCPAGQYPSYDSMNYEPEQLIMTYEQKPPPIAPPPDAPEGSAPDTKDTALKDPECPGPNAPRIGDVAQNQTEKVSGYELQKDPVNPSKKICVILYEDIGAVQQYLPTPQIASTTAVIATVATGSALLAKPLADLLLKVVKPAIKKAIGAIQKVLGKAPASQPSVRERMELQRERTKAIRELKRMKRLN